MEIIKGIFRKLTQKGIEVREGDAPPKKPLQDMVNQAKELRPQSSKPFADTDVQSRTRVFDNQYGHVVEHIMTKDGRLFTYDPETNTYVGK